MFKVLSGEKKRRALSPATIAASVAAHVLLLGGLVYASTGEREPREVVGPEILLPDLRDEPPAPKPMDPAPPPPPPAQPDQPTAAPVTGEVLQLPAPTTVPDRIKDEAPGVIPLDPKAYDGDGRIGDIIGPPPAEPTPPSGTPDSAPVEEYFPPLESLEERPVLQRDGLARALERHYPAVLRDSRVGGRVVIEVVVDETGRVRPNSARVIEASHPAFGEATLRAVERFRFSPARMAGVAVPVRVTVPIVWTAR